MSDDEDVGELIAAIPIPRLDPLVNKIMYQIIPILKPTDLPQALSVLMHLFGMAISNCPREVREQIVRQLVDPILELADEFASIPPRS
jgi:hypothetical protein